MLTVKRVPDGKVDCNADVCDIGCPVSPCEFRTSVAICGDATPGVACVLCGDGGDEGVCGVCWGD